MCKIFDWVFDSVSVEQAPQNHVQDPNQFNQNEDEDDALDIMIKFLISSGIRVWRMCILPSPLKLNLLRPHLKFPG